MAKSVLGYVDRPGVLHRLTGTSKLVLVIALVVAGMITFDARLLLALSAINIVSWVLSRVKLSDLKVVLLIILAFMVLNNLLIFAFSPQYGVDIFGTRTVIWAGAGRWVLTREQLFYQGLVTLKYFAMLPSVLLFIATTPPSEFASSLNALGVPYRTAYAVALAMRYIPDVQQDFETISLAQQARGLDSSKNVPLWTRVRHRMSALTPLLLGSIDRIETTAAAMELRGFGERKRRTWYAGRTPGIGDWAVIALSVAIVAAAVVLVKVNGGRYWNPFA